jgi:hypothetical protein
MRIERSVTSISWLPSEAISSGVVSLPFELGLTHYDEPPSDVLGDFAAEAKRGAFRFANRLSAFIEVEEGRVVASGPTGKGYIGSTLVRLGPAQIRFPTIGYPEVVSGPDTMGDGVRFVQTAGGRTSLPSPRIGTSGRVGLSPPPVWTTLALTLYPDGTSEHELLGASPFPRHWVYDTEGRLVEKSGLIDFSGWYRSRETDPNPWGGADTPVLVAAVESELERGLSSLMVDRVDRRRLEPGDTLVRQGDAGTDLFFLLDGVLEVDVDGRVVAEVGPGAILGEHAALSGGTRTAALRAIAPVRVAVVPGDAVDRAALEEIGAGHRRETDA